MPVYLTREFGPNGAAKSNSIVVTPNGLNPGNVMLIPKWALIYSGVGLAYLAVLVVTANVVVLNAPRAGFYQESCTQRSCWKGLGLKCLDGVCDCDIGYTYTNKCVQKKGYSQKCNGVSTCKEDTGMVCRDGSCKCNSTMYWNGQACSNSKSFKQTCSSDVNCLTDALLYCDTKTKRCLCDSSRFYDGSVCAKKRTVNEGCSATEQCDNSLGLECINKTCDCSSATFWNRKCLAKSKEAGACATSAQCYSPMSCSLAGKCECSHIFNYFEVTTLSCLPQKLNNEACSSSLECREDKSLMCIGGACQCDSIYLLWSTNQATCIIPATYKENCTASYECKANLGLTCQSSLCLCSSQYWNGSVCINYASYNEACINDDHCAGSLICRVTATSCSCPTSVSLGKCDCPPRVSGTEYYWDGSECASSASYNQSCTTGADYTCKTVEQNTICAAGICTCAASSALRTNKCVALTCDSGWQFFNNMCYKLTSTTITVPESPYNSTSSSICTACDNKSNAKLAVLYQNVATFLITSMNDEIFVDGYRIGVSSVFKSQDLALTYASVNDGGSGENCVQVELSSGIPSFSSNDCNGKYGFCEYAP